MAKDGGTGGVKVTGRNTAGYECRVQRRGKSIEDLEGKDQKFAYCSFQAYLGVSKQCPAVFTMGISFHLFLPQGLAQNQNTHVHLLQIIKISSKPVIICLINDVLYTMRFSKHRGGSWV